MDKSSIRPGRQYAIREHPSDELQRVKILESVRPGKWRVEWVDPNPGLVDYVQSRHIIVPWAERRAFLRDERNAEALAKTVESSGYLGPQHPVQPGCASTSEPARLRPQPVRKGFEKSATIVRGVIGDKPPNSLIGRLRAGRQRFGRPGVGHVGTMG